MNEAGKSGVTYIEPTKIEEIRERKLEELTGPDYARAIKEVKDFWETFDKGYQGIIKEIVDEKLLSKAEAKEFVDDWFETYLRVYHRGKFLPLKEEQVIPILEKIKEAEKKKESPIYKKALKDIARLSSRIDKVEGDIFEQKKKGEDTSELELKLDDLAKKMEKPLKLREELWELEDKIESLKADIKISKDPLEFIYYFSPFARLRRGKDAAEKLLYEGIKGKPPFIGRSLPVGLWRGQPEGYIGTYIEELRMEKGEKVSQKKEYRPPVWFRGHPLFWKKWAEEEKAVTFWERINAMKEKAERLIEAEGVEFDLDKYMNKLSEDVFEMSFPEEGNIEAEADFIEKVGEGDGRLAALEYEAAFWPDFHFALEEAAEEIIPEEEEFNNRFPGSRVPGVPLEPRRFVERYFLKRPRWWAYRVRPPLPEREVIRRYDMRREPGLPVFPTAELRYRGKKYLLEELR